jgi:hypothetical protein
VTYSIATLTLLYGAPAQATSFAPYLEQRVVDARGHYYVVVRRQDETRPFYPYGPVTLTIAERRAGTPAVAAVIDELPLDSSPTAPIRNADIRVRDGDIVHGTINLDQPPGAILIPSTGKGIVTLDVYGFNNLGLKPGENDVVIYSLAGQPLHRIARTGLFDATDRATFPRLDGVLSWLGPAWLDEDRNDLVIVGYTTRDKPGVRPIITVHMASGLVERGGPRLIDRAISERNRSALADALDLAKEMKLAGTKAVWPGILDDEGLTLEQRLRSAVLLASFGDHRGAKLVSTTAILGAEEPAIAQKSAREEDVYYAIEHLTELVSDDALPTLKKVLSKSLGTYHFALIDAFKSLGRKAVPTLVAVLEDDQDLDAQLDAATCLGFMGPQAEEAIPALIRALRKNVVKKRGGLDLRLDSHAAWALKHMGEKATSALPDLERLAKDEDEHTRRAAQSAINAIRGRLQP